MSINVARRAGTSALFNMMRNLGGSVGIAILSTLVEHREHCHFSIIPERITHNAARTATSLAAIAQALSGHGGNPDAGRGRTGANRPPAGRSMAYGDSFFLIGVSLLLSTFGRLFLTCVRGGGGGGAH